jgi:hypothetical protein
MLRVWVSLIVCLNLCVSGLGQQNNKADEKSARTMQIVNEWSTLQAVWGAPAFQPVSGSSLELVEIKREKPSGGPTVIHYNFKVKGLPQDATYVMEYWKVGSSHPFKKIASGVKINKEGLVVCSPNMACGDRSQPEFPLEVAAPEAAKGDPHRFVLTSQKNPKIWVTGIATPFPIRSASDGCQLEIVRLSPNGEILLLSGTGFPANQNITLQGNSAGENHIQTVHTDTQGHFQSSELPSVVGKSFGILEVKVAQGSDCHPSIVAEWGEGSHQPL